HIGISPAKGEHGLQTDRCILICATGVKPGHLGRSNRRHGVNSCTAVSSQAIATASPQLSYQSHCLWLPNSEHGCMSFWLPSTTARTIGVHYAEHGSIDSSQASGR
ncbi:hypothetical protein CH063_00316, partial [Colletotrichum higginsianum]